MAGRWTDERDERDWRSEGYGGPDREYSGRGEGRSFDDDTGRSYGAGRDRVFGERDTGAGYNSRERPSVSRADLNEDRYGRGGWQRPDYGGVSPAMQQGEYELERNRRFHAAPRFQNQDYTRGGRYYGDDGREPIYREQYGQGGRFYGAEPRGYDAGAERSYGQQSRRPLSGGTGGYDYSERGYGDGGRGERFEERAREAGERTGDFFQRAGERLSSWFGGAVDDLRGAAGDDRHTSHRGRGPKGYVRPDDRISDDAHRALTDDPWLDAGQVSVSVSGGEVTLSGTVDSREAKHRAERCVEDISGVTHVQNNLRVQAGSPLTSPSRGFGDSVLEAQMRKDNGLSGGTNAASDDSAASRTTTRRT